MKTSYKEFARSYILAYFQTLANKDLINGNGLRELFEIQNNEEVLYNHIVAMKNIFQKAIEEMDEERKK